MTVTYNQVEQILTSLPVGYYLKRKTSVKLSYSKNTYYDLYKDEVNISYNTIIDALNNLEKDVDEKTLENVIRCLLYHEVSHIFLSPKMYIDSIVNIVEDERIETICKDYYIGVDFKKFVKLINNYTPDQFIDSATKLFYHIVRFNNGPQDLIDEKNTLINSFLNINCSHTESNKIVKQYYKAIYELWTKVKNYFDEQQLEQQSQMSNQNNSEEQKNTSQDSQENTQDNEQTSQNTTQQSQDESDGSSTEEESEESINTKGETNKEEIEQAIENATKEFNSIANSLNDTNLQQLFQQLIFKKNSNTKQNSSAINNYSGRFDVRSVVRDDYKWFVRQNRLGNVKRFSKIKLNLFIDTSGSYYDNVDETNKLIYNLIRLEKQNPDFSFDVITMSMSERLLEKNNRFISARGGNRLDEDIFNLYKKVQDSQSENYNIILFDGDALSDAPSSYAKHFKAFNHSNCIIISDRENKWYIADYAPAAKTTITDYYANYAKLLITNVINLLKVVIK